MEKIDDHPSEIKRPMTEDLIKEINLFQLEGYAKEYFKKKKKGIFRRKVPLKNQLKWTPSSLSSPLLKMKKESGKQAKQIFKRM